MTSHFGRVLIAIGCTFSCWPLHAYKEVNHRQMSEMAVDASVLSSQDKLDQLGLRYGVDDGRQRFPVIEPLGLKQENIRGAVSFGADFEDSGRRVVNHFFNPLNNKALTWVPSNATSPDWALEDNSTIGFNLAGSQNFSYRALSDYFLNALINPTKTERDKNWGLTFQTLGQVLHHLQDMTQPQHVRDDIHLDLNEIGLPNIPVLSHPSTYEKWVANTKERTTFAGYPAYAPVYSRSNLGSFTKPRQFWTTSDASVGTGGNGIAEYTNRGFFSVGTVFLDPNFPAPIGSGGAAVDVVQLCSGAVPACPAGVSGVMSFTQNTVTDTLRPALTQDNPRARAFSIYNSDLTSRGFLPTYTLNRFTYDSAAQILIPRAIGYSAGLLNFFFRGRWTLVCRTKAYMPP